MVCAPNIKVIRLDAGLGCELIKRVWLAHGSRLDGNSLLPRRENSRKDRGSTERENLLEGSLVTEAGLAHGIDKPSPRPGREESGSE